MAVIEGTDKSEARYGTASADTIYGYGGNDSLYGRAGNDQIWGGAGADRIWGGNGNDILRGQAGDDNVYAGNGNDTVYGGIGNDILHGDAGTDKIWGDAGNDTIKGGTGISYLYGGDGNDHLHYDPTSDNISNIGTYLSPTVLDGGNSYDTLFLYSHATFTETGTGLVKRAQVEIDIEYAGNFLFLEGPRRVDPYIKTGTFTNIEVIVAGDNTPIDFWGSQDNRGMTVIGSGADDTFTSSYAIDTFDGGAGNDLFRMVEGSGVDRVFSNATDSDTFYFTAYDNGAADITGFNGAGVAGGDKIIFAAYREFYPEAPETYLRVSEWDDYTEFYFGDGAIYAKVDAVGLKPGLDYDFQIT